MIIEDLLISFPINSHSFLCCADLSLNTDILSFNNPVSQNV